MGPSRGVLRPGGLVWFPRQVPHAVANLSPGNCEFLTVITPSEIEDFFRAQRGYLATVGVDAAVDPAHLAAVPGGETRPVVGPPLS